MRLERRIVLPVEPVLAWAVLMDWERQAEWMRDADRVEVLSPHREGAGVLVAVRTRVFNIPAFTERLEVVAWEPPRRMLMAHRSAIHGTGEWILESFVGGTRFTWIEDVTLPLGVVGRAALAVYRPFMRRLMGGAMGDLRRSLVAAGHGDRA
jgi:Polyketide cyclase / dehydrase and lipid transport